MTKTLETGARTADAGGWLDVATIHNYPPPSCLSGMDPTCEPGRPSGAMAHPPVSRSGDGLPGS